MKLTQTQIDQKISLLPENIRHAVETFNWTEKIMAVGNRYELGLDKITIFHQQTLLVVVGETPASEYEDKLVREMHISRETADDLVEFANEYIFKALQKIAFAEKETRVPDTIHKNDYLLHDLKHSISYEDHVPEIKKIIDENPDEEVFDFDVDLDETDLGLVYTKKRKSQGINKEKVPGSYTPPKPELKENAQTEYQEEIEPKDTQGIYRHRTSTTSLKQGNPKNILDVDIDEVLAPFSTKKSSKKQTLEKEAMELGILSKGDRLDLSFRETDFGKEMKGFIEQLDPENE
jgi:hypothetical protein